MSDKSKRLCSLIVASDDAVLAQLKRVVAGVIEADLCVVPNPSEARAVLDAGGSPSFVIAYFPHADAGQLDFIKEIKAKDSAPTVIIVHDKDAGDTVPLFLAGADDTIEWPCSIEEMSVRMCVRLGVEADAITRVNKPVFDCEAVDRLRLTKVEHQILRVLSDRMGQIVSRDELSIAVDHRPWEYGDRKFDVHVAKIRKKLAGEFGSSVVVSTIRLAGYRLAVRDFADDGVQNLQH